MITQLSGNARILLTVDERGSWEQLYYPYPGLHQQLRQVRLGIYDVDDESLAWVDKDGPAGESGYVEGSNAPRTRRSMMGLNLTIDNLVHPNMDMILRRIHIQNRSDSPRRLRVFHYQSLQIAGWSYRDTAFWDPDRLMLHHYKRSYHLGFWGNPGFDAHTCGEHTLKGLKGSYVDAEDGALQANEVSHGAADSIAQWNVDIEAGGEAVLHMYVLVARSRSGLHDLWKAVDGRDPALFINETVGYWNRWLDDKRSEPSFDLSSKARDLYRRSLFLLHNCSAENGATIASPDATTLKHGGDGYEYCWWRDGAYIAKAMSGAGLRQGAHRFLQFAARCQEEEGFFLHRHFPDGYLGPTWHPPSFLQIDQTASVVDAVYHHYLQTGDLEQLLEHWELVRRGADYLMSFVDERGLPQPSFDLWEEKKAVNAYSVGTVVQALRSAARIGQALSKRSEYWSEAAERMRHAALATMWNPERKTFYKSIEPLDETVDASTLLVDLFPPGDPRYADVVRAVEEALWQPGIGGVARYEGDKYFGHENPWIICTLWLAKAHLRLGDRDRARELIEWAADRAGPGGMLPEQVDAESGERRGVVPLVWSHSTFVDTVNAYSRASTGPIARPLIASIGGGPR